MRAISKQRSRRHSPVRRCENLFGYGDIKIENRLARERRGGLCRVVGGYGKLCGIDFVLDSGLRELSKLSCWFFSRNEEGGIST